MLFNNVIVFLITNIRRILVLRALIYFKIMVTLIKRKEHLVTNNNFKDHNKLWGPVYLHFHIELTC